MVCATDDEPVCEAPIRISMDDDTRFSISDYRLNLYKIIVQRRKELRRKKEKSRLEAKSKSSKAPGSNSSSPGNSPKTEAKGLLVHAPI